jgi:hypothetical protein
MISPEMKRLAPRIGLAIAIVAFFVVNVGARHDNYFFYDEYEVILHRYGLEGILHPTNGHPVIMWLPLYYLMREVFGLGSALPYELLGMAAMAVAACIVYGYLRARAGEWVALIGAVLILFFGAGGDILFWAFQLAFAGSIGAGVAALWALDRETPRRDVYAALLLIASVFFLAVGLAFVAAAAVAIVLASWSRGLRAVVIRLAKVVGPAVFLYIVWYLAYGHDSPSRLTTDNLINAPNFMLEGIGSSLAFLVGLAGSPLSTAAVSWGLPLLAALVALAVWRVAAGPPVSSKIWIGIFGALVFWFLTAVNKPAGGNPDAGRYCLVGAIFVLMVAAELVRGVRWTYLLAGVAAVLVATSIVGNLVPVRYGHQFLGTETRLLRANLAALDIAGEKTNPKFALTPEISGSDFEIVVDAGSYFKSKRRFGSAGLDETELEAAAEPLRASADDVLRAALPVTLEILPAPSSTHDCTTLRAGTPSETLSIPHGPIWFRAGAEGAEVATRRFADADAALGAIAAHGTAKLSIPPDRSAVPWQVTLTLGSASACKP